MTTPVNTFYEIINKQLQASLHDEILIHNKLYEDDLQQPNDIISCLNTVIKLECGEIKLIKKIEPNLITLKDFVSKNSDTDVAVILLKILICFYRLKNKLNLHLGRYGLDYEIFIAKDKEEWSSYIEDKFDFININEVYFYFKNVNRFHYKNIIYQAPIISTNKYFLNSEDDDLFYFYNYILLNINRDKLYSYLANLRYYGEEHHIALTNKIDISNIVINKAKNLKFISDMFLTLFTFDKSIQTRIFSNNKINVKPFNISITKDQFLEGLYKQSLDNNFNFIEVYNNLPNYIDYNKFNLQELEKKYKISDIISICESATKILVNYKRYLQLTEIPDIKVFKTLMRVYNNFNNLYYRSLSVVWNQIYYLFFNFSNKEYVLEYYYKNILNNKIPQLTFIYSYFENFTVEISNNYRPTFSLEQIKSLFAKDRDNILSFLVKKLFNIKENDKDYANKINIVNSVIVTYSSDLDIYYNLIQYLNISEDKDFEGRGEVRVKQLSSFFSSRQFRTINKDIKYLDYGGGDGEITASIAKHIKSSKDNTFVVDIEQWFGNIHDVKYIDYLTYGTITTYRLPYSDSYLDFITCFQVLHHIRNYKEIVKEFYRVLRPGGLLLLREHDCRDDYDRMLIDVEHSIYETTLKRSDKNNMCKYLSHYEAYYTTKNEWNELFIEAGFTNITKDVDYKLSEPKSPARYYYEVYVK